MPDIGHDQTGHQGVVQLCRTLEHAAVVEYLHQLAGGDATLGCVVGVQEDALLTLDTLLVLCVAVLAVEKRVRLGRDDVEWIALGQLWVRVG